MRAKVITEPTEFDAMTKRRNAGKPRPRTRAPIGSLAVGLLFSGALFALFPGPSQAQDPAVEAARSFRSAHEVEILRGFAELLAIPNVAGDTANLLRNADLIVDELEARGARMEVWRHPGASPLIYGELPAPGAARTLGIYVHYDGQPVDESRWVHGPWEPTLYDGAIDEGGRPISFPGAGEAVDPEWRIYARSAGDDKAPLPALFAALDALEEAGIRRTSNLVFLFDGEEEAGSPYLDEYMAAHRDRLDVDLWLFCDGPVHQSGRPQLTFGVRGVTGLSVTVYGATRSLHSGHYGNWAPVPGQMLAELLASMKDADGNVTIDGFYDTVDPIGETERAALRNLPSYGEELKGELGLSWTEGEPQSLEERLLLPSLTVRGLSSGNVGERARNVIPSEATAALGIRLVKGNDPEEMKDLVEAHIREQGYHIVREEPDRATRLAHRKVARIVRGGGYVASRTPMDTPMARRIVEATRRATEDELVLLPALGGSLPLYLFTEDLGAPAVIVPIANHDNNQHAPNENLRLANLWYGIELYAAILTMP